MCYKTRADRVQLQKLKKFLNKYRMWICLEDCITALECEYCKLIYQINYSYTCNKSASVKTFRSSILGLTFLMIEDIYSEHRKRRKWMNFGNSFKNISLKTRKNYLYGLVFKMIKIISLPCTILAVACRCVKIIFVLTRTPTLVKIA